MESVTAFRGRGPKTGVITGVDVGAQRGQEQDSWPFLLSAVLAYQNFPFPSHDR